MPAKSPSPRPAEKTTDARSGAAPLSPTTARTSAPAARPQGHRAVRPRDRSTALPSSPFTTASGPQAQDQPDPLETRFLNHLKNERAASPLTLKNYTQALRALRTGFPPFRHWTTLNAEDFRDWLFALMKRGLGRATIRLHFAALRSFYKYLILRENLPVNPLLEVQLPKSARGLPVVLTTSQVDELLRQPAASAAAAAASAAAPPPPGEKKATSPGSGLGSPA